jgi:hypothetical protein
MRAPDRLGPRLGRALVLGGSGAALGAMAHVEAGGAVRVAGPTLVATTFVLALAWFATARRVSWPVIALILGGGQVLTHVALTAGATVATDAHVHGAPLALPTGPASGSGMLALHLVAWGLLTAAFTVGEGWLWRTVERILRGLPRVRLPVPHAGAGVAALLTHGSALARRTVLGRAPPVP